VPRPTDASDAPRDDLGAWRFEQLFHGAGFGIAITDLDGRFVGANAAYTALTGYTLSELRARDILSITHPDDREMNLAALGRLLRLEVDAFDLEKRYVRPDGDIVWIRGKVTLLRGHDGTPINIVGTFDDITSAKRHEHEVVRLSGEIERSAEALATHEVSLARQAALLDEATDAIIVRGLDHVITYWNRSAEELYGWSADEAVGTDIRALLHDNVARFDEANAELVRSGSWSGEFVLRSRAGARLIVAARWTLIHDADGTPDVVLAINTDITEQRRTQLQLVRAQRLESIGTLAGGVAHDLNNMLSPILLAAELLRDGEVDADRHELISTILNSARRGADLVAQLLSFARGVDGERRPVDVAELLHAMHSIVRETFPKNIAVRVETADALDPVTGDRTQIQQVLLNLCVNARDAMPEGGNIVISASTVELDGQYVVATDGAGPGRYVVIEVEDDGQGMPVDVVDRVFEPFFTTKEPGSGTGLGLSVSAGIVQSHGGFIRAYSELGSGSRFRVYLPTSRTAADDRSAATNPVVAPLRGAGETILIVDDEDAIRATTRRTLEAAGYLVVEASNGAEAVAVFARHQQQIDVVLIDMTMPVMDGASAIHALRSLEPEVRIVAASGLHGNGKTSRAVNAGVRHFLPKPYTTTGLLQAIAEALAE
jgi:PAS domain S-box-containing protein